eukprot:c7975_g1_i1 orf=1-180(-)
MLCHVKPGEQDELDIAPTQTCGKLYIYIKGEIWTVDHDMRKAQIPYIGFAISERGFRTPT